MSTVTVIGGGVGGLTAAILCAREGAAVRLLEAHEHLGGRARSTGGPYVANLGPHAAYLNLAMWKWLKAEGLLPPVTWSPTADVRFFADGRLRRTPPIALLRGVRLRSQEAPDGVDFRSWMTERCGAKTAELFCGTAQIFTFDHDPGRLSAAFVWERIVGTYLPPFVRYIVGGWSQLVERLADRARQAGVVIETGTRVRELPERPVIVATELAAARALLGDETLRWESGRAAVLDVAMRQRRHDPAIVIDLDGRTFTERVTAFDRTLAPEGEELIQAHAGIRPGETPDAAVGRIEAALDAGYTAWRQRETWRRRQVMDSRTGALDLPGSTWRDRPAIDRGDGIFLAGDMVAAPGLLSEVAIASARNAARGALSWGPSAAQLAPTTA